MDNPKNGWVVFHLFLAIIATSVLGATPPEIQYQPRSQTVILYQPVAFGVIVRGSAPISYQWRKDGAAIAGATNDQFHLSHAQRPDAGRYSVVVSNAGGGTISEEAILTVNYPRSGDVDYSFQWGGSINGTVYSIAEQPNGKVLIGGEFTMVNGGNRGHVARLNADGTTDRTFMEGVSGADWEVTASGVQSDGRILIGGHFLRVNDLPRNRLARLNADGSADPNFLNNLANETTGIWGDVFALAVQSDDKIIVGGFFPKVNAVGRNSIARLNPDGSLDTGFSSPTGGADNVVYAVAMGNDGKVVIGGMFTRVDGIGRKSIARLNADGNLDTSFMDQLSGVNGTVRAVAVQSDGKVLIAGDFSTVNGVGRTRLARLNDDGTLDASFLDGMAGVQGTAPVMVYCMVVEAGGRILIGGDFGSVNGISRKRVARLNTDGSLDTEYLSGSPGANGQVRAIVSRADGSAIIAGAFTRMNLAVRSRVARLTPDGVVDTHFENPTEGASGPIGTAVVQDGKVVIGGTFDTINGVSRTNIARLNEDGTVDTEFRGVLAPGGITCITLLSDSKLLIGGVFNSVDAVSRNAIARLNADGTLDTSFLKGLEGFRYGVLAANIHSLVVQNDGKIIAGGFFATVNGVGRNNVARLNPDGSLDESFQNGLAGVNREVLPLVLQSDGKVLIGGDFLTVNGSSRAKLARLNADGTLDTFLEGRTGPDSWLHSIAYQDDGKILIGGNFQTVNGLNRSYLARLNPGGTVDSFLNSLSGADGFVETVRALPDGTVLAGGVFNNVNGTAHFRVVRLSSDGQVDAGFQPDVRGRIVSVVLPQPGGKILIGGDFYSVNGIPSVYLARLWGSQPAHIENVTSSEGGQVTLTLQLPKNSTNRVQFKNEVNEAAWTDLPGDIVVIGPDTATNKVDSTVGAVNHRFYRVQQIQ